MFILTSTLLALSVSEALLGIPEIEGIPAIYFSDDGICRNEGETCASAVECCQPFGVPGVDGFSQCLGGRCCHAAGDACDLDEHCCGEFTCTGPGFTCALPGTLTYQPCVDVVCPTHDAQPELWYCDSDEHVDAVCAFGDLGWVVAQSSEDCVLTNLIDDFTMQELCRPIDVATEVLDLQRKLDSKMDTILHNMGLLAPLVEDCEKDDPWCIHIAESGSTQLDEKFRGSTILKYVHDSAKDWLFQELTEAGVFGENDPMQCFEGRENVPIAEDFHRNCDEMGVFTVTFVRTFNDGSIFGLVSPRPFSNSVGIDADDAFTFSLYSGISEQAAPFRINPKPGKVTQQFSLASGPSFTNWEIKNHCMSGHSRQGFFGAGKGKSWEEPATEWEKSHMHKQSAYYSFVSNAKSWGSNHWYRCRNVEVWFVSEGVSSMDA